jgi:hypothetical protein
VEQSGGREPPIVAISAIPHFAPPAPAWIGPGSPRGAVPAADRRLSPAIANRRLSPGHRQSAAVPGHRQSAAVPGHRRSAAVPGHPGAGPAARRPETISAATQARPTAQIVRSGQPRIWPIKSGTTSVANEVHVVVAKSDGHRHRVIRGKQAVAQRRCLARGKEKVSGAPVNERAACDRR